MKSIREFDSKVNNKENMFTRKNFQKCKRYTRTKMLKERTEFNNSYNAEHFKLKMLGVHGGELPSFYQTNKEWWKQRKGYVENPNNISHCQVQQDNKFWSRNDPVLISDFTAEPAPQDAFKVHFKIESKKENFAEKPNHDKRVKVNENVKKTR